MTSITIVVPSLARGGMTRAYLLAIALERLGCDVDIVGSLPRGGSIYPRPSRNIRVSSVDEASFPEMVRAIRRKITGRVIYAVKPKPTSFGISLIDRMRSHRPVIVDIDDWDTQFSDRGGARRRSPVRVLRSHLRRVRKLPQRLSNPDYRTYVRWTERMVPLADAVTTNTRFLQGRFGGAYVPSGKDTDHFDPTRFDAAAAREWLGLSDYRVLMFPGTARRHKGLEDVLSAMDAIDWPDLRLVIVGGRDVGDVFTEKLQARWPHRIIRLPRFGMEEMPRVVAAAHVIVAPQRETPAARAQFPMKLTDAMAMAKPIITTSVGDIPQVLDGAARIVAPGVSDEIADAITQLLEDPAEADRLGKLARDRCLVAHSLDAVAESLRPVLSGLKLT